MIRNKKDLEDYLTADYARLENGVHYRDYLLRNEKWYIWQYLKALRHVEYYINKNKRGLLFYFWWIRYKRMGFKIRYNISPNTIERGLGLYHIGDFIWVHPKCQIGRNCTLRPGVVFGRKSSHTPPQSVKVGDNCDFGVGAKIIGDVCIGNNVSIGANAVVTKDIPNNAVAVGIPARVIKILK